MLESLPLFLFSVGYDLRMATNLASSNPYLRDPRTRKKSVRMAAASSSAVEGIRRPFAEPTKPLTARPRKRPKSA